MKFTTRYIPPPPPEEPLVHEYTFLMTGAERVSIINALQLGLNIQVSNGATPGVTPEHTRALLRALGVGPCR